MIVRFENVGREKKCWSLTTDSLSDDTLEKSIRQNGSLMSRGVDFDWNIEGDGATIIVGGFRPVGSLTVEGGFKILGIYVLNSLFHKIPSIFILTSMRESTTLNAWRNLWKSCP